MLSATLRADAKAGLMDELIHRTVPYPVFLVATHGARLALSLAHKRWSQGEAGSAVLDGELVIAELSVGERNGFDQAFQATMALARQPRAHLLALYQGWMDKLVALLAARVTGAFATPQSPEQAAARQEALRKCARLDDAIAPLRAAAAKEKQVARQADLNLELKRVKRQRSAARQRQRAAER